MCIYCTLYVFLETALLFFACEQSCAKLSFIVKRNLIALKLFSSLFTGQALQGITKSQKQKVETNSFHVYP